MDSKTFQHDKVPEPKERSVKTWHAKGGVEKLECPALSLTPDPDPTEHLWHEMEHWLHPRPPHLTLVPDLIKAPVAKWEQIPTATLNNLVESLPWRMEVIIKGQKAGATW